MTSGIRPVFIVSALVAGLMLAASDARAPNEARTREMAGADRLLATGMLITRLDCPAGAYPRHMALRFERITAVQDEEMRALVNRGAQRQVNFEWNAQTGELSFSAGLDASSCISR